MNQKEKHIRRSDELHEIYKGEYEIDKAKNTNFSYFRNLKEYNFNYNYEIFDQGKRIVMDKPTVPVIPEYLKRIIDSLNIRSSKVATSLPAVQGSSQENIQLQGGNLLDMATSFTPLKVK